MTRPVGFDDQAMPEAYEVSDVAAQENLSPEFQAVELAVAQEGPQQALSGDGRAAHVAGLGEGSHAGNMEQTRNNFKFR